MSSEVKNALEKLKLKQIRITPQRHAILTYMFKTNSHPSADEIYRTLEKDFPNMSVATVYNNLKVFLEAGLVEELLFGDNSSRYEIKNEPHYHIICRNCGKIEDVFSSCLSDMEEKVSEQTGYIVDDHKVEFFGVCCECQKNIAQKKSKNY